MRNAIVLALVWLSTGLAHAELDVERILVPVYVDQAQPGAFGSFWATDLWVFNSGHEPAAIASWPGPECLAPICVGMITLNPGAARRYRFPGIDHAGLSGFLLYAEREDAENLHLSLRVHDESRGTLSPGTEVPVVRSRELHSGTVHLLDVPVDPEVRITLRVYAIDAVPDRAASLVKVTGFFLADGSPAYETVLPIYPADLWHETFPGIPDFGMVENLQELIEQGRGPIRLEVQPLSTGSPIWAMVTATNNESQHVTVISPTERCSSTLP